jgi:hypothetical protein
MSSISNISSGYLQSILSGALQGAGLNANTTGKSLSSAAVSSTGLQTDNQQLSPFAQLMNTLQQLQQSDPIKYQQVTQQIAINLQRAAQTSQADGNSTAAKQLNQLAADFTSALKSGQLPNIRDLALAIGGHHHHHHGHHSAAADSDGDSSSSSTSSSAPQSLSQLSALQPKGTLDSLNPMSIILNTLSSAGIGGSNS